MYTKIAAAVAAAACAIRPAFIFEALVIAAWWMYVRKVMMDETTDAVWDSFFEFFLACVVTAVYIGAGIWRC